MLQRKLPVEWMTGTAVSKRVWALATPSASAQNNISALQELTTQDQKQVGARGAPRVQNKPAHFIISILQLSRDGQQRLLTTPPKTP